MMGIVPLFMRAIRRRAPVDAGSSHEKSRGGQNLIYFLGWEILTVP